MASSPLAQSWWIFSVRAGDTLLADCCCLRNLCCILIEELIRTMTTDCIVKKLQRNVYSILDASTITSFSNMYSFLKSSASFKQIFLRCCAPAISDQMQIKR